MSREEVVTVVLRAFEKFDKCEISEELFGEVS